MTQAACPAAPPGPAPRPVLAGDLAVWIFILAELLVFGVFFLAYAFARARQPELFNAGQATLEAGSGALNTLLLVSGSAFVAEAVRQNRRPGGARCPAWLILAAMACGAGFLAVKGAEFAHHFAAGVTLSTSTFHMFYLSLGGFHFLHVVLGMVVLGVLWKQARAGAYGPGNANGLESGAAYWHMVDLVWLVLFPLVYLMR